MPNAKFKVDHHSQNCLSLSLFVILCKAEALFLLCLEPVRRPVEIWNEIVLVIIVPNLI
jgi:hypothetical protein